MINGFHLYVNKVNITLVIANAQAKAQTGRLRRFGRLG